MNEFPAIQNQKVKDSEIVSVLRKRGWIRQVWKDILVDRIVEEEMNSFKQSDREGIKKKFLVEKDIKNEQQFESILKSNSITEKELIDSLLRPLAIRNYRNKKWETEVIAEYYDNKEQFDKVQFNMIIVKSGNLAQEIYFRIKDKENTWEEICKNLGVNEKSVKLGPTKAKDIEAEILNQLYKIKKGQLTKPFKFKSGFAICELIRRDGEKLTEEIREEIISSKFERWLDTEIEKTLSQTTTQTTN